MSVFNKVGLYEKGRKKSKTASQLEESGEFVTKVKGVDSDILFWPKNLSRNFSKVNRTFFSHSKTGTFSNQQLSVNHFNQCGQCYKIQPFSDLISTTTI